MKRIAVFVSGSGSDMQAIIDASLMGNINGNVVLVIANKPDIYALERADIYRIPWAVFPLSKYGTHELRDDAILAQLTEYKVDLVVLAGYLSIVTNVIINSFKNRIINIHPSLIPKHCGKGYYGLKVHESVINSGDKETGATVHYVDEGADTGAIIEQVIVEVEPDDTAESLQARVLQQEHKLLPRVVARLCR